MAELRMVEADLFVKSNANCSNIVNTWFLVYHSFSPGDFCGVRLNNGDGYVSANSREHLKRICKISLHHKENGMNMNSSARLGVH